VSGQFGTNAEVSRGYFRHFGTGTELSRPTANIFATEERFNITYYYRAACNADAV